MSRLQGGPGLPRHVLADERTTKIREKRRAPAVNPWSWIRAESEGEQGLEGRTARRDYLCNVWEQSSHPNDVTSCFVMPLNVREQTWSDSPPACFTFHSSNVHFKHYRKQTSPLEDLLFLLSVFVIWTLQFEIVLLNLIGAPQCQPLLFFLYGPLSIYCICGTSAADSLHFQNAMHQAPLCSVMAVCKIIIMIKLCINFKLIYWIINVKWLK